MTFLSIRPKFIFVRNIRRHSRDIYVSDEATQYLKQWIDKGNEWTKYKNPDDLVFNVYKIANEPNPINMYNKVVVAGLFSKFAMKDTNYPVVRFGKIALMTNEKIEIDPEGDPTKLAHFYVVECQSLGGFSGSPVFFELDRVTSTGVFQTPEIYLGGVMRGHYKDTIPISSGMVRELNAGLALVTPCYLLNELLHTKEAKEQREELSHKILDR